MPGPRDPRARGARPSRSREISRNESAPSWWLSAEISADRAGNTDSRDRCPSFNVNHNTFNHLRCSKLVQVRTAYAPTARQSGDQQMRLRRPEKTGPATSPTQPARAAQDRDLPVPTTYSRSTRRAPESARSLRQRRCARPRNLGPWPPIGDDKPMKRLVLPTATLHEGR